MTLTLELHLLTGLAAVGLGISAVLSGPRRARNRVFGLLCAGLATWSLGVVGWELAPPGSRALWTGVYLLGACAAAPLGLHFTLQFRRMSRLPRRLLLTGAYGLALGLWISSWTPAHTIQPWWNFLAAAILGGILGVGLGMLARHSRSLPSGPERSAHTLLLGGALVAIVGGLSDFIPRSPDAFPLVGPIAVQIFLVLVCATVMRHRFLDVTVFLARILALLAGALLGGLFLYGILRLSGLRLFPLIIGSGVILSLAVPGWRLLRSGARALFAESNPVTRGLTEVSNGLTRARDRAALLMAVRTARQHLPAGTQLGFYLRRGTREDFHLAYRISAGPMPASISADSPLARHFQGERKPITRRFVADEAAQTSRHDRERADAVLEEMQALRAELVVPVFHGDALAGCLFLGGDIDPRFLTAELADTFMAVSNQAMESLERIEALERAQHREALAAVGEMAAGLAHEIRNPVAAIRGAAQLLATEGGNGNPGRSREMLEVIQEETAELGRVVSDFLDYARPSTRRPKPLDLGEEVRRARRAAAASGMGLAGTVRVDDGTPTVWADPDQLQRIFRNLIRNAREAAGAEGSLDVSIAPAPAGRVAVRFQDDGQGIPAKEIPKLFQPFHTTKPRGTGLGLALVHRLVEAHSGEILVDGRPGQGAVFTVLLPAQGGPR